MMFHPFLDVSANISNCEAMTVKPQLLPPANELTPTSSCTKQRRPICFAKHIGQGVSGPQSDQ